MDISLNTMHCGNQKENELFFFRNDHRWNHEWIKCKEFSWISASGPRLSKKHWSGHRYHVHLVKIFDLHTKKITVSDDDKCKIHSQFCSKCKWRNYEIFKKIINFCNFSQHFFTSIICTFTKFTILLNFSASRISKGFCHLRTDVLWFVNFDWSYWERRDSLVWCSLYGTKKMILSCVIIKE